jgi:hypothetical protein
MHGEAIIAYKILAKKSKGMRPLGKSMCRWENNIIIEHSMNHQVPYKAENFSTR